MKHRRIVPSSRNARRWEMKCHGIENGWAHTTSGHRRLWREWGNNGPLAPDARLRADPVAQDWEWVAAQKRAQR